MAYIMVLNDGSTYTDLRGCKVVEVSDYADSTEVEMALAGEAPSLATLVATFSEENGQIIVSKTAHVLMGLRPLDG